MPAKEIQHDVQVGVSRGLEIDPTSATGEVVEAVLLAGVLECLDIGSTVRFDSLSAEALRRVIKGRLDLLHALIELRALNKEREAGTPQDQEAADARP